MIDAVQLARERPEKLAIKLEGRLEVEVRNLPQPRLQRPAQLAHIALERGAIELEGRDGEARLRCQQREGATRADHEGKKRLALMEAMLELGQIGRARIGEIRISRKRAFDGGRQGVGAVGGGMQIVRQLALVGGIAAVVGLGRLGGELDAQAVALTLCLLRLVAAVRKRGIVGGEPCRRARDGAPGNIGADELARPEDLGVERRAPRRCALGQDRGGGQERHDLVGPDRGARDLVAGKNVERGAIGVHRGAEDLLVGIERAEAHFAQGGGRGIAEELLLHGDRLAELPLGGDDAVTLGVDLEPSSSRLRAATTAAGSARR